MEKQKFDSIIIGGGPAGLSAATHLAWHNRPVLVLDRKTGPLFFTIEKLFNVPGMPETRGTDIQRRLRKQAEELGASVARANVTSVSGEAGAFEVEDEEGRTWEAKTLLLATGVIRYHPTVDGDFRPCFKYAGKGNMYYCPDCEAPEISGKETIVIGVGPANGAAAMAYGLSRYTPGLRVLSTTDSELADHWAERLEKKGIPFRQGEIKELIGQKGQLLALRLTDGSKLEAEAFFVSTPAHGRTELAKQLGLSMAASGHHVQPKSQRGDTSVEGIWIAGDVRPMTQQVSVAIGTGNIAAVMIDQYLRKREVDGVLASTKVEQ